MLGFANFLQDFIPLYANIVGPLKKLRSVKKISEEDWESSGGKKAFETLKEVLSNTPVLHNPDWAEPFFLETDALQYGVGAVLFQKGKDGGRDILILWRKPLIRLSRIIQWVRGSYWQGCLP